MKTSPDVEIAVVGMGVVGLAIGRHLARRGREVLLIDRADSPGMGISARNSGVIHAGIYYPERSLKAGLCVSGCDMLYDYCRTRQIDHARCGKLIVATAETELARLHALGQAARHNGVDDLVLLDAAALRALEPALRAHRALRSPSTGIVDTHGLVLSLMGEAQDAGAMIAFRTQASSITPVASGARLDFADAGLAPIFARYVVNAAGLNAPALAATAGKAPRGLYAKGNYFALGVRPPFSHLIYPLPEPGGLGIHLTLDLAGHARFGPDVEWVDTEDYAVSVDRMDDFYAAIRRYWPDIPDNALAADYAGIRPKLAGTDGDFLIHREQAIVNLLGIESPGLTASLAIGRHVGQLLGAP